MRHPRRRALAHCTHTACRHQLFAANVIHIAPWNVAEGIFERCAMNSLVQEAISVDVEPEDHNPVPAFAREHEERAALGIELEALADRECE